MIYNVVLTATVQQSDLVIHTHIYIFFHILFHYGLSQDIEHCYTVGPCCGYENQMQEVLISHKLLCKDEML